MLRVDGQNRRPLLGRQAHDHLAAHHERLLVGQRQLLARAECGDGGVEPRVAHQRIDDHLRVAPCGNLTDGILARVDLHVGVAQRVAQRGVAALVGDDDRVGVEFTGLKGQLPPVAVGRQDAGFEEFGIFADDVEGLRTDGAGRPQNGKALSHEVQNTM